jgi:RNA polymerase sigma-70 factor (sigma-E family)
MNSSVGTLTERAIGVFEPSRSRLDSLGEWFAAEYEPLLRFAYFLTGGAAEAEDLVHDAFVRLYRANRRIEESGFRAYARRTIVNLHRSRFRRVVIERRALAASQERTAHSDVQPTDHVWQAILALPRGQRAVVALRYYEELSEQETAEALGVSVGTVKKQMNRAMTSLREALGERSGS